MTGHQSPLTVNTLDPSSSRPGGRQEWMAGLSESVLTVPAARNHRCLSLPPVAGALKAQLKEHRLRRSIERLILPGALFLLCGLPAAAATFRWSASLNTVYVEHGGSVTLATIKAALPNAPLDLVDWTNRIWLLRANLQVTDGCTLVLHGAGAGGDVNQLRLQSVNSAGSGCGCVIGLTADWGNLDINSTRITSWDTAVGGPDMDYTLNGRAYIEVRSSLSTNGVTAQISRMDI